MTGHVLDLYSRPGCHLCDDARAILQPLSAELGFEIREHNIEDDDDLHRLYLERIPVGVLDGQHLFDYFVDEAEIRARLTTVGER